jgi:hypothetical protein
VPDTLQAALASNHAEQAHLKKVGLLFAIMIPLLALSVSRLHSAQKVSGRELVSMTIFFGTILSPSAAGIAARYFLRVLPKQRQLDALVLELAEEPQQ